MKTVPNSSFPLLIAVVKSLRKFSTRELHAASVDEEPVVIACDCRLSAKARFGNAVVANLGAEWRKTGRETCEDGF